MAAAGGRVAQLTARGDKARLAGDHDEARRLYTQAVAAAPQLGSTHHRLGALHQVTGRPAEAERSLRRALALSPNNPVTRHALGTVLLTLGKYQEGFALYEARHEMPELRNPKPPINKPEWRGEDLAGKNIVVWPEQGFGDQIQHARFAAVLKARGADVTWLCRPQLERLFAESLGVRVVAAAGKVWFPDPDFFVMTCSVAGRLGVTPDTLPREPYLKAPGAPPAPRRFSVGLVTHGSATHENDAHRSLAPEAAAELKRLPVDLVSLHPEDTGAKDFAETASIIAGLDLVVTVDTAVAHLAGAMGKPCWVMLPAFNTDWRWMRERADSPWYPSVRLYRQSRPGDWGEVIARIGEDLAVAASAGA